jgi:hypothetical protein
MVRPFTVIIRPAAHEYLTGQPYYLKQGAVFPYSQAPGYIVHLVAREGYLLALLYYHEEASCQTGAALIFREMGQ